MKPSPMGKLRITIFDAEKSLTGQELARLQRALFHAYERCVELGAQEEAQESEDLPEENHHKEVIQVDADSEPSSNELSAEEHTPPITSSSSIFTSHD